MKNRQITLDIKKWGINGEGIGYYRRKPVFCENAIPGETVRAEILEESGTYLKAQAVEILQESGKRKKHSCPYWQECGGCSSGHIRYPEQVKMKGQLLKEALKKYAGYTGPILPPLKNPAPLGYRNALKLPVQEVNGRLETGFYRRGSQEFVPVSRCIIHTGALEAARNQVLEVLNAAHLKAYDPKTDSGIRSLVMREADGKVQLTLVTGNMEIPEDVITELMAIPEIISLYQSIKEEDSSHTEVFGEVTSHLAGERTLHVRAGEFTLELLPRSFYQLNSRQAENLYALVADWLPECGTVVEAYSGIGGMSLYAAKKAGRVIGIENVPDAVINANENAIANGIENAHFICGDAGEELARLEQAEKIDALIVDPPRSGLNPEMIQAIRNSDIPQILYVSCNPATLAKNIADLQPLYQISRVQPVDIFSQTPHVETVCLLSKP